MNSKRKPNGYWNDFANVQRELLDFIKEHGTLGVIPTYEELKKAGRNDLANALQKHGGNPAVAEKVGLRLSYKRKPLDYWRDFANIERELLAFIQKQGISGVMPTSKELKESGRHDLATNAIPKHGGYPVVAARLGLKWLFVFQGFSKEYIRLNPCFSF